LSAKNADSSKALKISIENLSRALRRHSRHSRDN
jgi:hypothetical protein